MKTLKVHLTRAVWLRTLLVLMSGLLILAGTTPADAAGRVKWKSTTIEEKTTKEAWLMEMEIYLSRPPDIAHQTMKFEFTQIAEYERSLVDGQDSPQERTVPLVNQQALIETVTVGFMDPGSGQIQSRTRFSFKVTRAHGYKAGKWKVKIREGESGNQIGAESTLDLKGENPVVDRRSISFEGKPREKKEKPQEEAAPAEEQDDSNSSSEQWGGNDGPAEDEGQVPPSIEEKPGGGCHHTPRYSKSPFALGFFALAFVGLFSLRRQRRN